MGAVGAGGCQDQIPSPSCRMEAVALLCKGARCFLLGSGSKLQLCRAALGPGACSFLAAFGCSLGSDSVPTETLSFLCLQER